MIPLAVQSLVTFRRGNGFQPISYTTDFILKSTLTLGLVFELPVVIALMSMTGVVTPQFLTKGRKYAILINFVIVAVLTPSPDALSQSLMAASFIILYEVGIIAARVFGKREATAAAAPLSPNIIL